MNSGSNSDTVISKDFYLPSEKNIKELRNIIRGESGHKFTYEETKNVAYELIRLNECLSQNEDYLLGRRDEPS